ncbi:tryptophan transporter [Eggerthella sinensis]|uniref:tryptophan transporter n=1 Tax=Eggerthella sinensis TaxID=242230 RepID=UPI00266BD50E|nr:tryptophan transporter [Eggerthella sinensis]
MEQQIKREVATQTAGAASSQGRKRDVTAPQKKAGLTTQDLILIAVLLAAGAVLKLTVGSLLSSMGMKPNFIIAMYCLAIILTRPKVGQALIIGLLAGLICQVPMLNATPLLNIPSELLGALACGLLIKIPMNIGGKLDLNPLVNTFLSTVVSGGTFALLAIYINVVSTGGDVMVALATYAAIVFGTATFNAILVQVLAMPLRKVLKR